MAVSMRVPACQQAAGPQPIRGLSAAACDRLRQPGLRVAQQQRRGRLRPWAAAAEPSQASVAATSGTGVLKLSEEQWAAARADPEHALAVVAGRFFCFRT